MSTRRAGLRPRLIDWFKSAPPGETITSRDVAVKFGVSYRYAKNTLSILKAEGLVENESVWRIADGMAHVKEPKHG